MHSCAVQAAAKQPVLVLAATSLLAAELPAQQTAFFAGDAVPCGSSSGSAAAALQPQTCSLLQALHLGDDTLQQQPPTAADKAIDALLRLPDASPAAQQQAPQKLPEANGADLQEGLYLMQQVN